jgi:hypothetical protein
MSSLSKQLSFDIDKIIELYVNVISEKYSIDKLELKQLWSGDSSRVVGNPVGVSCSNPVVDMKDLSMERLLKCTRNELSALCKSNGKKCSGKKDELISRLREVGEVESREESKAAPKPPSKPKLTAPSKAAVLTEHKTNVISALTSSVLAIPVRTNAFGNTEHPETRLIFDKKAKKVIGRQEEDGTIADLCDEDIENCKKYKFPYEIPTNLDKRDNLSKVKVKELEEDIDIQEEEFDIEEDQEVEEVEEEEEEVDEEVEEEVEEVEE